MTHSRVSRLGSRHQRSTRSRRSRSPPQERTSSRAHAADRSRRSRSPSPSHRALASTTTATSNSASGQSSASASTRHESINADAAKGLSMKERMAMWRKRKGQERSPSAASTPGDTTSTGKESAEAAARPNATTGPVGSTRPDSRASSVADESNTSSRFVTAPESVASESPPLTPAESASQTTTGLSTRLEPPAQAPPSQSKLKGASSSLSSAAKVRAKANPLRMSLGKPGFGSKRIMPRPSSALKHSVFGPDADSDNGASATNMPPSRTAQNLPSFLSLTESEDAGDGAAMDTDASSASGAMDVDQSEPDPLDDFMQSMESQAGAADGNTGDNGKAANGQVPTDDNVYDSDGEPADPEDVLALAAKRLKKKDLAPVDHSKMNYESFKRDFYIEPAELRDLTPEEVDMMRVELGGIKIRGVNPPKPATSWSHFGLPAACADVIKRQGFETPTPIQAQAIPAILSGRDMIGVAKTGSGKTLAFILPMLRHIKAQRALTQGEGPIGLVMTPTRELAVQIHRECRPFLRPLGLRAVCAYGGSGIKDQIGELKRGSEIVVCTPGRLIDLLCANSGRVTNLHRVTYLVLDEADRMFDMGFEPQVTKIIQGVRPSRQTVLFSATFPRQMEALARKTLRRPLEIVVGGRALIPPEVTQHVEVIDSRDKFVRLLSILGDAFNRNSETLVLIFVDRQEAADALLRDLMRRGYVCNSLHGGKDQTDRDQAIVDFKNRIFSVLIATSVAARGLDVRGLSMVVNYDCPNHMEDLVHRVGRTGRAGNKGDAYTFVTPDQDRYASEVVKAMKLSGLSPPADIQALADAFLEKVRQGKERRGGRAGFGGKGLEKLDKDRTMMKKIQKVTYGATGDDALDDDDNSDDAQAEADSDAETPASNSKRTSKPNDPETVRRLESVSSSRRLNSSASNHSTRPPSAACVGSPQVRSPSPVNAGAAPSTPAGAASEQPSAQDGMTAAARAAMLAAQAAARRLNIGAAAGNVQQSAPISAVDQINRKLGITPSQTHGADTSAGSKRSTHGSGSTPRASGRESSSKGEGTAATTSTIPVGAFGCELDINDYPQKARWRATNRDTLSQIIEQSGAAITTRGVFVPPGKPVPDGERKLYLSIEADTERAVERAKNEIKRILTEATLHIMEQDARGGSGRYTVV
ncbi:pre-mRNA processing RNA-helicase [Coemansia guatemalensis]|uniref:RNA helicase n=1 Tax=Coemansia guatemalensis TaxID=2761395 RepID=A0A9W8LTZ0_9FUNG|nr:pre-mRNA processing RNA-helicase [Coemansia guatemalensis]